jgi:Thioesterase domain
LVKGDIAAYNGDGEIVYLSRGDNQVKINGQRVELSEIESTLSSQDEAISVLLIKDKTSQKPQLTAFYSEAVEQSKRSENIRILAMDDSLPRSKALIEKARQNLPPYMVPRRFIQMTAIPLTGNGKVNSRLIKEVHQSYIASMTVHQSSGRNQLESLKNGVERELYDLIRARFGEMDIRHDTELFPNIFDSLSLMVLVEVLRRKYGDQITVTFVTKHPVFGELAQAIERLISGNNGNSTSKKSHLNTTAQEFPTDAPIHFPSPPGSEPSKKLNIFTFFLVIGFAEDHGALASVLPSFNIIGVNHARMKDPTHYKTIADMAEDHAKLVRAEQPHGPYFLCGFSFAGHVAYVVAQYLEDQGETVHLIIIDSSVRPRSPLPGEIPENQLEKYFGLPKATTATTPESRQLRQILLDQILHNLRLMHEFQPAEYKGPMLFMKTCKQGLDGEGSKHHTDCNYSDGNGYEDLVKGKLEITCIPSTNHFTMLKENASLVGIGSVIAKSLQRYVT